MSVRTSVRMSVRLQEDPSISMKFGMLVEVGEWCKMVCSVHQRSRSRSQALESRKFGHFQRLSPLPFIMGAGKWPRHNTSSLSQDDVVFLKLAYSYRLESRASSTGIPVYQILGYRHKSQWY